ncbi:MAG: hypothetical protein H7222_00805 [Methylotenera sp.]|nr:hypothetical protein [Oligoflexia bacterium]
MTPHMTPQAKVLAGLGATALIVVAVLLSTQSNTENPGAAPQTTASPVAEVEVNPVAAPGLPAPSLSGAQAVQAAGAPALPTSPPLPPLPPLDEKQWTAQVERVEKAIPTIQQVRALPAEALHETPAPVREAAEQLGEMSELLHQHPEKLEEGANFYRKCAAQTEYMGSIRALCAANLRNISVVLKKPELFQESEYPSNVKSLTDKIPSGW